MEKLNEGPICDCQDNDGFRFATIQVRHLSADQIKAEITFTMSIESRAVTLDLVTSNNSCWIADIHRERVPSPVTVLSDH